MERYDIYKDIAGRTGGDIYIGVVGPVRTGKSTFISKFMDKMVLPKITGKNKKKIAQDELPQSAEGKTVMTTEPKFVPSEGIGIDLSGGAKANVRLIDCVGYVVDGAIGVKEGDSPRMVNTPWSSEPMSFEEASEYGTKKVINEHSTIGIVVTSDGSVTDIERANYVEAEERVINELKAINKPFIIVLNSRNPNSKEAIKLRDSLEKKYNVATILISVADAEEEDFALILEKVLFEFPLRVCSINIPKWIQALPMGSSIISQIFEKLKNSCNSACKMKDISLIENAFSMQEKVYFDGVECKLGEGLAQINLSAKSELFYEVLSEECKQEITDEFSLMSYIEKLVEAKTYYDTFKEALPQVEQAGYGIVNPNLTQIEVAEPEIVKRGREYCVKIGAKSYSYHMLKIALSSHITPLVGTKKQCEDFANYLKIEKEKNNLENVNIFGKSLAGLISEEMSDKMGTMPESIQQKMNKTITRIVNEGKGGVLCILL